MSAPLQHLLAHPVVAILRGVTPDTVLGVAQVLLDAGFRVIEVPLNSPSPLASIEALAREFGEWSVRVNAVSPGLTLSDGILSDGTNRDAQRADIRKQRAIHRDMHPSDIVGAVSFLMSPDSEMFTGQNLVIDGGMVMN